MTELAVQVPRVTSQRATLLDLLDRVLGKGVVAYGDIVLSIADLDLVYLNLRAVLSSIGTLEAGSGKQKSVVGSRESVATSPLTTHCPPASGLSPLSSTPPLFSGGAPEFWEEAEKRGEAGSGKQESVVSSQESVVTSLPTTDYALPTSPPGKKLELDPKDAAQGLAKLAMTLIHLLRKLMERQAIRRMEAGTLNPEQLERAGQAFQRLDDQIKELCKQFGLKEEDLNLDLGPLGKVV